MARQKVRKFELRGAANTGGGVGAWQNPEPVTIVIERLELYTTVVATGAATVDAGTTPTSATTSSDNLIDGLDVNAATGLFDNITEKGTNGKSRQTLAPGKWITVSRATGDVTGLVGTGYVHYHRS